MAISVSGKLGPDVQLAKPTEAKPQFSTKSNATLVEPKNEDSDDDLDESDEDFDDEVLSTGALWVDASFIWLFTVNCCLHMTK